MRSKIALLLRWYLIAIIFILVTTAKTTTAAQETNLYKILGVSKSATTQEIKKAYRKKALATHPDKNTDIPKEDAAEAFRQVVHAFEILSDDQSRKHYDRTGKTDASSGGSNGGGRSSSTYGGFHNFQWSYTRTSYYQKPKLKDRFDVQEAMSRVMHIVSMEQLKTVMTDENDLLERNLLMVFVNPTQDTYADDEMVFPYPFAALSSQGIWWEDLLQTVKIRYHRSNEITQFFNIPNGQDLKSPVFVFGKRGQALSPDFAQLQTRSRKDFESWVWKQLEINIHFFNKHPHPVEVYWIHGTRAQLKFTLQHWEGRFHNTMLSHEWWVRDARTDTRKDSPGRYKLANATCLANWKILNDKELELIIEPVECFDLSGHCGFWKGRGECKKNPNFMRDVCQKSCEVGACDPKYLAEKEREEERKKDGGNDGGGGNDEL